MTTNGAEYLQYKSNLEEFEKHNAEFQRMIESKISKLVDFEVIFS